MQLRPYSKFIEELPALLAPVVSEGQVSMLTAAADVLTAATCVLSEQDAAMVYHDMVP